MKKRLLSMILALGMMLTILPVNAITAWAENGKIIQSGNCGNNVTYDLTQNNDDTTNPTYTLTIKGNGEMADFKESDNVERAPWIAQKEKITAVTIENGVTYVGEYAFDHCKKLTQITIRAQLNSIGKGAFRDCEGLTSIEIPKTVTSIGASAFSGCKGLSNIEIPETVVSIGGAAFDGCTGLTSIKIPATVTSIKEYTFNECSNLKNVEIPQGVVSIGECAFSECGILESIKIPQNVTSIGEYAFSGCQTLTSIKIPAKVTSISKGILFNCSKLEDVEILGAVTSIGDSAFMSCMKLTDIKIPETVTSIGKNAFYMSGLTSIKIPDTVTSIGEYAFYGCNSLAKIEMPANMPNILQNTFYRTTTTVDETRVFYYPGYRHNWDQQVSKISDNGNTDLLANDYERVHYYCDVIFDSNGGTFTDVTDGSNTKTIKEVWRKEHLTQEQINSVGKPTKDGKMFIGWNTTQDATTVIDPKSDYIADGKIYYAVYKDAVPAAVTITDLDGTTVKAGEAKEFTVNVTPNDDANTGAKATITVSGANANAVEKIQYKDGETWKDVPGEGLSIDEINNTEFKLITKADANDGDVTITVTAKKADGTEIDKKVAAVTVKKHENAAVTITDLDGTTVKAGEAKEFTVNVTPNDDANTGAKATITVSGANANAVEKIQYKDGETWKDVPGEGLSIDEINNTEFKLITKADANDGDVTITVTAKKADGTEIDKKVAAVTVKKHENAAVTITDLDGTTVKAGEAKEFTVNVTPNDDTIDKVTFGTTSGEVQWSSDNGNTWTTVPGDVDYSDLTGKQFRVVPAADAANGTVTVTVTAKKADGTEAAKKDASFTVTKKEEPVTPGGGSTGGGENPGENPGSGSTTPKRKLEIADGTLTSVTVKDENGNLKDITDTITKDLDGKYEIPVGAKVTVTAKDAPEGMKFGEWSISDKTLLSDPDVPYTEKDLIFTMPDNPDGVKLSVVYLEESIGEEPNLVEKGALAGTVVVGSAALLYQGHMLGTELYLRYLLPHGAVIPQNRAELAVLLWQDAENPEPVSTTLYSDISDEDSAIQQAARWAVENDLMEQLDADEHPDHFDPFVPVTFSDSIRAWKKAQELKKSVH